MSKPKRTPLSKEILDFLVEMAQHEVPITLSSLLKTVYNEPDVINNVINDTRMGRYNYHNRSNLLSGLYGMGISIWNGSGNPDIVLVIIDYNNMKKQHRITLNDNVLIVSIKISNDVFAFINSKYINLEEYEYKTVEQFEEKHTTSLKIKEEI